MQIARTSGKARTVSEHARLLAAASLEDVFHSFRLI